MIKAILRFLGIGMVPKPHRPQLVEEGVELLDEVIGVTMIYRDVRAPGQMHRFKESRGLGSLVLTSKRLVGYLSNNVVLNVPLTDERMQRIEWFAHPRGSLSLRLDAGLFQPDWEGTIELTFHTLKAREFMSALPVNG